MRRQAFMVAVLLSISSAMASRLAARDSEGPESAPFGPARSTAASRPQQGVPRLEEPSDPAQVMWLSSLEGRLIDDIRSAVRNDTLVARYLAHEKATTRSVYERIDKRVDLLAKIAKNAPAQ